LSEAAAARERRIGYLCAFLVLFVWAGFLLSSRLAGTQPFTAWDIAALRFAGGSLAALPLVLLLRPARVKGAHLAAMLATAAFGFPILAYHGFGFAPVAHAGVMNAGMLPFLTAGLAAIFLGERFSRRRALSLAVVACGIGLIASDTFGNHPGAWRGDLLFLAGASCWAVYTLLVRHWRISAEAATLSVALWAGPIYLPIWWFLLPSNLAAVPLGAALYQLVFQGVFAAIVAGFLFTRAVTALGAPRTTAITALVPGMAALAAWPLLGEPLGLLGLLGIGVATLGMILAVGIPLRRA
jgi:drug/metabolite transporter (DMT)-like permease